MAQYIAALGILVRSVLLDLILRRVGAEATTTPQLDPKTRTPTRIAQASQETRDLSRVYVPNVANVLLVDIPVLSLRRTKSCSERHSREVEPVMECRGCRVTQVAPPAAVRASESSGLTTNPDTTSPAYADRAKLRKWYGCLTYLDCVKLTSLVRHRHYQRVPAGQDIADAFRLTSFAG